MSPEDLHKDYNDTDIAHKAFDYEANPRYLPMWGVQKVDFTLAAGKRQDFSDIDLLRAVAKVKVYLSNDMKKMDGAYIVCNSSTIIIRAIVCLVNIKIVNRLHRLLTRSLSTSMIQNKLVALR